jgi:hypothetical protein
VTLALLEACRVNEAALSDRLSTTTITWPEALSRLT